MARDSAASADTRSVPHAGRSPLGTAYWRTWTAAGLSNLADGILKVAIPLVAIAFTRSPMMIAGLTFAFTLPWLLFALPVGAFVDRLDRRRLMLGANLVRAAVLTALVLAMLLGTGSIWVLYAVALCVGTAETIYDISAQSIVPQLVRPDQLPRANGRLYAAELTANEFAGPPLAGFLVATSMVAALAAPAALWGVAVLALLIVRGTFRIGPGRPATLRADIAEGLRFLWRHRILRTFTVMVGIFNLATTATITILVLYAVGPTSPMGLSATGYGGLLTTVAAGSVLGSFIAARIERALGRARTLVLSFFTGAVLVGIPGVTTNPFVIGAAFLAGGAGIMISNIVMVSLRQTITPARLLGRVTSAHRLLAWGAKPLGAAAGGLLAQLLEPRAVFAIMGALALATITGMTRMTDNAMNAAARDTHHP